MQGLGRPRVPFKALNRPLTRPIFTDFYRFVGLSWETSPQTDSTPEASRHSGSGRTESSSKSTTLLTKRFLQRSNESRVIVVDDQHAPLLRSSSRSAGVQSAAGSRTRHRIANKSKKIAAVELWKRRCPIRRGIQELQRNNEKHQKTIAAVELLKPTMTFLNLLVSPVFTRVPGDSSRHQL